jgi:hypothetical protein
MVRKSPTNGPPRCWFHTRLRGKSANDSASLRNETPTDGAQKCQGDSKSYTELRADQGEQSLGTVHQDDLQRHMVIRSLKKPGAEFRFQIDNLFTKRRVADPQGLGGFSKTLVFCDG